MTNPVEYKLSAMLAGLIGGCERSCVAGCCGIDAFVFSPLYVAAYISAHSGQIRESDIAVWESEIAIFERETAALVPTAEGFVCRIESMCQSFTREDLAALVAELRHSLAASPKVLALSDQLSTDAPTHKVVQESRDRIRKTLPPKTP